jgi:enoyl-CoA hydratase/carnithine racemase
MRNSPARLDRTQTDDGAEVAVLTFADGELNLFGKAMLGAVCEEVAALVANPPRALLIRAEGRAVSAGVDVQLFDGLPQRDADAMWSAFFDQIVHPLENLPCPTVFAAHALTLTAAFEMALCCDLILASPNAKFGLVERVVGLTPSMGGPQRLAERAGSGRARELIMTGDLYGADTLHEWGVVNAIHDDVDAASRALAIRLADGPTRAHAATKQIIAAWRSGGVLHADSLTPAISASLFETGDLKRAVTTFVADGPRATTRFAGT